MGLKPAYEYVTEKERCFLFGSFGIKRRRRAVFRINEVVQVVVQEGFTVLVGRFKLEQEPLQDFLHLCQGQITLGNGFGELLRFYTH